MEECEYCGCPESMVVEKGTPRLGWVSADYQTNEVWPFKYWRDNHPHYMQEDHNICETCFELAEKYNHE